MIIDVSGINTTPRSDSEGISPGNLPNQLKVAGKKRGITPKARDYSNEYSPFGLIGSPT